MSEAERRQVVERSAELDSFWHRLRVEVRQEPWLWILLSLGVILAVATMVVPLAFKFFTFGYGCGLVGYVIGRAS